jgi:hypothetical protein
VCPGAEWDVSISRHMRRQVKQIPLSNVAAPVVHLPDLAEPKHARGAHERRKEFGHHVAHRVNAQAVNVGEGAHQPFDPVPELQAREGEESRQGGGAVPGRWASHERRAISGRRAVSHLLRDGGGCVIEVGQAADLAVVLLLGCSVRIRDAAGAWACRQSRTAGGGPESKRRRCATLAAGQRAGGRALGGERTHLQLAAQPSQLEKNEVL